MGERMTYGYDKTIHSTTHLHVEVDDCGRVVAVWFRCQPLPFDVQLADPLRAKQMIKFYEQRMKQVELLAVDIERAP